MTQTITPAIALNALRVIFGPDSPYAADLSVLARLTQRDLASRFRSRSLLFHPDRAGVLGQSPDALERAFKQLHGAYRVLSRVLEDAAVRDALLRASQAQRTAGRRNAPGGLWTPDRERTARPARAGHYYRGKVPETELRFAQFLYYHGVIDWKTMIDSITWQYRVRPKVGEIGRAYRFLNFEQVTTVLRTSPRGELFGDTALRLGLMDRRQLSVVLGKQHLLNYPIGRYFIEHDILSRPEVDHLLAQNRRHNLRHRS